MAARAPLVRVGGQNRQLPAGDNIGLPRSYQQESAPSDSRVAGDRWFDSATAIEYEWIVDADSGQWVESGTKSSTMTGYTTAYDVEITDATKGIILRSANGTRWRITIDNSGTLVRISL